MATRLAWCAALSAAALVIGASTIAEARAGGGHATAHASRSNVSRSNVSRTNVSRTNVSRTNVSRTNVSRTNVSRTNVNTRHTNVGNLHSNNTTLQKTNIKNTNLKNTNINNTNIKNTNIKNTNVNNTNISNTKISNTNIKNINVGPLQRGPGAINVGHRPIQFPVARLANNRFGPIWRQHHRIWWGGRWRVFVPFTALAAVTVGGRYYYPDAYVGVARPYCGGVTAEGCQLNWQQVNFEDGGGDWQCVQFCPRQGAMQPPQAVALAPQQPQAEQQQPPQGSCEVTIFSDGNFGGTGVTTGDEQPTLSQSGWQNQIASIQVKTGTWDFFSDENFGGQAMRLAPGPYQDLGPEWTKKIGSFQCVQPGS